METSAATNILQVGLQHLKMNLAQTQMQTNDRVDSLYHSTNSAKVTSVITIQCPIRFRRRALLTS